ncbi:hypothetical protein ABZ816_12895 [Actinosynnema sp. NPDC047251]|uniref:Uncharacterized protein n=1 Tax=Saccharothrix espanaensis (strain ATCC 51144 / DSM 44229 / JCM 9112 / NBRC 15066 / NRRL 15764) TaxID=1179773 RepID=K0KFE6_SACES|nr:hypothetical protein [Saccharothrix espanaensis]CCH35494.1 hypothetical protein BN6_82770 [Saccharothrix espanaensis DSM 44229]
MAVAKFNAEAMEQCRSTVGAQAGQFGAVGDGFAGHYPDPDIFGKLANSGGLSAAAAELDTKAGAEFAAAESLLGEVERALDRIQGAVVDVEDANAASFRVV